MPDEPTLELVLKRNSIERLKREKFPLDVVNELPDIIERGYENISRIPGVNLGRAMGRMAESPIPGGRRFSQSVPGGSLAKLEDSWKWIEQDMLKYWEKMSPEDRLHYVEQSIANDLVPPLRLDRLAPRGRGGKEMDADTRKLLEWLEQDKKKKEGAKR